MRLSTFIDQNMEAILVQWEHFAATRLPAATTMTPLLLRDHAQQILEAVVKDITTPQTDDERDEKSKGRAHSLPGAPETAAEAHGLLRATSGFDIRQMASEYRALRTSVLRLWIAACQPNAPHLDDVVRFNEAIDQALAESINFFTEKLEESRDLFLGTLSHDMRTPLQAILFTAEILTMLNAGDTVAVAARRMMDSGARLQKLLDDLIEYNQAKLGVGVVIKPSSLDIATLFSEELDQLRAAYPGRRFDLRVEGLTKGVGDGTSLRRLLGNLVVNAIKYGKKDAPVVVQVAGKAGELHFEVQNEGVTLDTATLQGLFDPLKRGLNSGHNPNGGLGLGLYIARQVAKAHNGEISARCEDDKTVFFVRLPWAAPNAGVVAGAEDGS